MASSIPHPPSHGSDFSAGPSAIDFTPPPPPTGFEVTMGPARTSQGGGTSLAVAVVIAVLMIGMALFVVSQGAPGEFIIAPIIFVLLLIGGAVMSKKKEERLAMEAESAELERQERLRNEIADAVKEGLKSNIKVRCRYCGSLNDESASKCDSCGATL